MEGGRLGLGRVRAGVKVTVIRNPKPNLPWRAGGGGGGGKAAELAVEGVTTVSSSGSLSLRVLPLWKRWRWQTRSRSERR